MGEEKTQQHPKLSLVMSWESEGIGVVNNPLIRLYLFPGGGGIGGVLFDSDACQDERELQLSEFHSSIRNFAPKKLVGICMEIKTTEKSAHTQRTRNTGRSLPFWEFICSPFYQ